MPTIEKFTRSTVVPYGNENAVASFYQWLQRLFDHDEGYTVVLDKELTSPDNRQQLPFPCIVINQIDTTDNSRGFFGGEKDQNTVLFYIYCMVNKNDREFGTIRLLRRMKDQVVFALKHAGRFNDLDGDISIAPIVMRDFSQTPPADLGVTLVPSPNLMQHFSEDTEILEYEVMVSCIYKENSNT